MGLYPTAIVMYMFQYSKVGSILETEYSLVWLAVDAYICTVRYEANPGSMAYLRGLLPSAKFRKDHSRKG